MTGPVQSEPLDEALQLHWPMLLARLGERRAAFIDTVSARCAAHGFEAGLMAARFANLCFALGPGFENRPEGEWALAILLDDRLKPWAKLHQLVTRATTDLERRGGEGPALAAQLRVADSSTIDRLDPAAVVPGATGPRRVRRGESAMPRVACDLEAVEIRLLDTTWRQEYRLEQRQWIRKAIEPVAPVRIDAQHPCPERITVLARVNGEIEPGRLQVRTVHHARCGLGLHPSVAWIGGRDSQAWKDEAARAAAWPVTASPGDEPPRLLQAAWHDIGLLEVDSCGLRDSGLPMGSAHVQIWRYWARQSLLTLERDASLVYALPDPKSSPPAVKPTRVTLEQDGIRLDTKALQLGFDDGLRLALGESLQRLLVAWQAHVQDATLRAEIGLFDGKTSVTWGLREGPRGMLSPPVLRVVADIEWSAHAEFHLQGRVEYAGAKANLHLRIEGRAGVQALLERLHADQDLMATLQASELRWRWPVQLEYDALADGDGGLFSEVGPCTGALTGSLGLRPSVTGGGGWEWFATLALEPVSTRVVVHDPLLGRSESHMALLSSVPLLDWSLA